MEKEFLKELKALLNKYDANINPVIDGDDLHGVESSIEITIGKWPFKEKTIFTANYIDATSLPND